MTVATTTTPTTTTKKRDLPRFVAIQRLMKLPVISSGVDKVTYVYVKVKTSNRIFKYSLENAEKTLFAVADMYVPIVIKLEDPINKIDDLMCKSLDIVEHNFPIITYTPEEIYFTTKTFVKAKVEPVLKRADSVKQLTMLDDALSVADKYVDKYLPDKDPSEDDKPTGTEPSSQTVKTIRHVNHFSRKLQRRLTRRTIAEAKLLKKQGYDTVQCFVYFADLLAKDPKAFAEKMKAIWLHLSEDEPENQKPPENIEQLIEMLTRESARRFVHVTNFVAKGIYTAPAHAKLALTYVAHEAGVLTDKFVKFAHLEKVKGTVVDVINAQLAKNKKFVDDVRNLIMRYLSLLNTTINESKDEYERNNKNNASNNKTAGKDEKNNAVAAANNQQPPKDENNSTAAVKKQQT